MFSVLQSGAVEQWSTACINISSDKLWLSKTCSLTEAIYKVAPSYLQHGDIPVSVLCQLESCEETRDSPCNMRLSVWPPTSHLRPDWPPTMMTESACAGLSMWLRGWRCTDCWQTVYSSYCRCTQYSSDFRHVRSGSPLHSHKAQHLKNTQF